MRVAPIGKPEITNAYRLYLAIQKKGYAAFPEGPKTFKHDGVQFSIQGIHYMFSSEAWQFAVQWVQNAYTGHMARGTTVLPSL
jgi:hypothetical protein